MNFTYLSSFPHFSKLYEYCSEAEEFVRSKPTLSAISARKAMEFVVKMIYTSLVGGDYGSTVFDMVTDERFVNYINSPSMINSIHFVRKMGNIAAHGDSIVQKDSLDVLDELHFIVGEFCVLIGLVKDYPKYVEPTEASVASAVKKADEPSIVQVAKEKVVAPTELVAEFAPKMRATRFQVHRERDEEENKKLFLRASLAEAGWPIVNKENQAMPASAGLNILLDDGDTVDYVLYGRDNRPLAIVEYETTTKNLIEGRMKAIEKANKMEVKYGYKPIIYYTNGYHIYIIDQLGYAPRRVFQFHFIEELELLKLRATSRLDITAPKIDESIAGRSYQKLAIERACKAFMEKRRHALLVMATGTGKTRVSIALSDVLLKAGWVKNILFLADRTSLVRQAHKNYTKLLPGVTTSVYSGGSMNKDPNARIIFSTYQTMINLINDDTREFGIGRFDLIIIDEAHRSIFKKYSALFHYFDSLMVGLTATPRSEENKNTYKMFGLMDREPDFAYELEEAVSDGYLVGFTVIDKTPDSFRRGIRYDDLSDEEKENLEDAFASGDSDNPGLSGMVLPAYYLKSRQVINIGTIDAMLNDLMKNGLKIDGGDKLGKTIIFASSHMEAEKIVERFNFLYSYLGFDFCKLVDCHVLDSQSIIDSFGERNQLPQITVSVDMLDTGIDVPDVLNLVFFKSVGSKIKFLQMIGRGTRLSEGIYGAAGDKKGFYIFDYYDNFRYFNANYNWNVTKSKDDYSIWGNLKITPQSVLMNERRLTILRHLIEKDNLTPFEEQYKIELKEHFINAVRSLNNDDIEVQYNMAYVSKYRTAEQWDGFTDRKMDEIATHLFPLLHPEKDPMKVRSYDLLMWSIEAEAYIRKAEGKGIRKILHGVGVNAFNKLDEMYNELLKLKSIPEIVAKESLLLKLRGGDWLIDNFSFENCEKVRKELRGIMKYLPDKSPAIIINVKDIILDDNGGASLVEKSYSEKAQDYITKGSVALSKLRTLDELSDDEKAELETAFKSTLGSEADYASWSGNKPLLAFLRTQVGIADEAIETKFGSFLNADVLTEDQLSYMKQIISYAKENGDVVFMDLQQVSPFCDYDIVSLFGENIAHIKTLINGIHRPII